MVRLMLTTQTPIFIYWGEDAICLYNDAVQPALGAERFQSALGQPGRSVWSEIWSEIGAEIEAVRQGRGETSYECKYLRLADGASFRDSWWTYSQSPIDDPESPSGIGGVLVISSEITAAVQAQRRLAEERKRLLTLFEHSSSFIASLSGPDHRFELTNEAYRALVGRTDLLGLTVRDALPEVEEQGLLAALDKVFTTGEPFVARGLPVRLQRTRKGELETRWLDFIYHRTDDAQGAPAGVVAEGFDVTDRVLAEQGLRSANEALKAILTYSPDLVVMIRADGRIDLISDSARDILGYSPADLKGRQFSRIMGKRDGEQFIARVMNGEPVHNWERQVVRADGATVTIRWAAVWAAELQMVIAIGRDVSERMASEERLRQAQKMEAIGQLTGGVAHDFNNLLTVIIGSLEMLGEGVAQNPELQPLAQLALNAAERGAEVTSQLLSFARRQPQRPVTVTGTDLAAGFAPLARTVVRENIHLEISGLGPDWRCRADRGQLQSALLNLCINARDAMGASGWLSVAASFEEVRGSDLTQPDDPSPGTYACLRVTDTGCGMSPEVLAQAIEPFFTTKGVGRGTGLGLSMVYGFVRQSGGFMRITSQPGQGTSVAIYLPEGPAGGPGLSVPKPQAKGPRARILVVEDNDLLRQQVGRQLTSAGHEVVLAQHAAEALDVLAKDAGFDLLFTDIAMPGAMDGRRLAAETQRISPDMKVLFTTGYAELVHGADGPFEERLLTKPYKLADLLDAIQRTVGTA